MSSDLGAFVKNTLLDEEVSRCLNASSKLRILLKRLLDEIRELKGESEDDGSVFPVKNGAETKLMRACDIFFFESRGRKIALRTRAQEITFYSNFDALAAQLPNWFLRCHRGYIVNMKKMTGADFAENTLTLSDDSAIPISRTYRDAVRAAIDVV
jgi:DNA-binding LytR/AlgR family response regulator